MAMQTRKGDNNGESKKQHNKLTYNIDFYFSFQRGKKKHKLCHTNK